jgi:hypothetical protein
MKLIIKILNHKFVVGALTLATVLTVGLLANTKHGQVQKAEAAGGCTWTITFNTPTHGSFAGAILTPTWGGADSIYIANPGTYGLPWSDTLVEVVWTDCPHNTLGNQGEPMFSVRSSYCIFPPAQAGKTANMLEGFYDVVDRVQTVCAPGCPVEIGLGAGHGYQCSIWE